MCVGELVDPGFCLHRAPKGGKLSAQQPVSVVAMTKGRLRLCMQMHKGLDGEPRG